MPINYADYPQNWKTEIRPAVLKRAGNKCEFCGIGNHLLVLRGRWQGQDVYQNDEGEIFSATNSERLGADYVGEVAEDAPERKFIRIVLTVAHLDHNIENNEMGNLRALCQRCHNRLDAKDRAASRKAKKELKQPKLF